MQSAISKTFDLQTDLGLYCRTGINEPETSIQEHTFQYRRLVYNVIKDTLKTAFPMTIELIGKKRWKKSVAYFFENHKCQTPQIWKLPFEFYEFYLNNNFPFKKKYPFILDLLHYEWLEIEVFMMEDLPIAKFNTQGDIRKDILIPNPEIKILPIQYPFHLKKVKQISEEDRGQYFVTIHRDFYSKQVKFNDFSYPFVEMLLTINEVETAFSDLEKLLLKYEKDGIKITNAVDEFLNFSLQNNILLGFKPNSKI